MKFSELVQQLSSVPNTSTFLADDPTIVGVSAVDEAAPQTMSYVDGDAFAPWIGKTKASALILPLNEQLQAEASDRNIAWISTPHA